MLSCEELHIRAALFHLIRDFFSQNNYLEVDTPIRQPVIIPESNIVPLAAEGSYLQTSPELYMKRLLASGCSRIFQICRCFRKEEKGRHHLEEFAMLEWYKVGADYGDLMQECQELLHFCLSRMRDSYGDRVAAAVSLFSTDGAQDAQRPWRKRTVAEAFAKWSPILLETALSDDLFDEVLVEHIEPQLGKNGPEFLYDYPASLASLARKKSGNEAVAERFELYVEGIELANGFSELTDTIEQRCRFEEEIEKIQESVGVRPAMPERFLKDLKSLPECAGIAFGLDRLVMLLLGKDDICDAVVFSPQDLD